MFLIFDTETTGLPEDYKAPAGPAWPRLVSISWQLVTSQNEVIEREYFIVKPKGFTIPEEVVKIHGISTEIALKEGKHLGFVLGKFSKACSMASVLVAHNIEFDIKIVKSAYIQANLSFNAVGNKRQYCTKEASKILSNIPSSKGEFKALKLAELYRYFFNEDFQGAHNSECDTEACKVCFFEMQKLKI